MTDDETIELGEYCEDLLSQGLFQTLVQSFDQQCFQHMMLTAPKDKMEREGIYAQWSGANAFVNQHIRAFVDQKNQTLQRIQELSEQDAHIQGID